MVAEYANILLRGGTLIPPDQIRGFGALINGAVDEIRSKCK
jgi:hypothetical protein